ncbi:MAG: hypothetical protein KIS81_08135 [Maricaulaceae bacterium]|nr:hypothetical protein [Maricaulaceae bacterium]
MMRWLLAVLALALPATPAAAQYERAWTCEFLTQHIDDARQRIDAGRGDRLLVSTRFQADTRRPPRWPAFEDFLSDLERSVLTDYPGGDPNPRWTETLPTLPREMLHDLWRARQGGGDVRCPEIEDVKWVSPEEASEIIRRHDADAWARTFLPPGHPDHLPRSRLTTCGQAALGATRIYFIHPAQPVFDRYRLRAATIEAEDTANVGVTVYRRAGDRWVFVAAAPSWVC